MKERYYSIKIWKEEYSYNEGFLQAEFDEQKQIVRILGILTEDVVIIDLVKGVFVFEYYEYNEFENDNDLAFRATIEKEDLIIPNLYKCQGYTIEIGNEVRNKKEIEMYKQILNMYIGDES